MIRAAGAAFLVTLFSGTASAEVSLTFPGFSEMTEKTSEVFSSYKLPIAPFIGGSVQTLVAEGPVTQTAWIVRGPDLTTFSVMDHLRQQVEQQGFELLFECETRECGGFDFRFQTKVLPEPVMHIDLGDYRFLSAQRLGGPIPEYLSLFVSRSIGRAHIQMILVGAGVSSPSPVENAPIIEVPVQPDQPQQPESRPSFLSALENEGHVVLDDLDFVTGSARLETDSSGMLEDLSAYLKADTGRQIALVGHTDSVGSLEANIRLSRARARTVAEILIADGVAARQVIADGVGFLSPRSSNLTEDGRSLNRRVEAVLISSK